MNSVAKIWADAINYVSDESGAPSLETIVRHIRVAIVENGFIPRSRLTSGLKEAYRPFGINATTMRDQIEEALRLLLLAGDIDQFATAAGRAYTATYPRRVGWGGALVAVLGGVAFESENGTVRRVPPNDVSAPLTPEVSLADELGRPDWRTALVSLGGTDVVDGDPSTLFSYASSLAVSGERFALEPVEEIALLSKHGDFFGKAEPTPSGRWTRVAGLGIFPAIVRTGYQSRNVVLHVTSDQATLWQPPARDIWQWIVIGATLAQGDSVLRYDAAIGQLTFLTPPPRQLERAVRLTGMQKAAWTWQVEPNAFAVIEALIHSRSGACTATPTAVSRT
ncbi:MAG: hypothetical protein QOI12_3664 [Alphaproteobacteria bacterium]|jgi:hypothetical protein|nr:hypothetical protein [Alphaproteobacteria bacterium]